MQSFSFILFITLLAGCSKAVNHDADMQQLTSILQQERKAHFANDVDAFLAGFADTTVQVNQGKVNVTPKEVVKARFTPYFESVTFSKWDDAREPIIEFSADGSMAYAVLEKTVVLSYPDTLGNPIQDSANYAWVSIYKKLDGNWKLVCNASTMEPQ